MGGPGKTKQDPVARLPRLVLDTNVFFGSAWDDVNPAARLIALWRGGEITLCVSRPVVGEYKHILAKTPRTRRVLDDLLPDLESLDNTVLCDPTEPIHIIRKDKSDNKFVECAVAASAAYIISSDKHLRQAQGFRGITVLSAGAYLTVHEAGEQTLPPEPKSLVVRFLDRLKRLIQPASSESGADSRLTRKKPGARRRASK